MYEFSVGLSILTNNLPPIEGQAMMSTDVSKSRKVDGKITLLRETPLHYISQTTQLQNRNALISLEELKKSSVLSDYVSIHYGSKPGQTTRVTRFFWEVDQIVSSTWVLMESSPHGPEPYSGKSEICLSLEKIHQYNINEFGIRGKQAWGNQGIILSKMNTLPSSLYCGQFFDDNTYVLLPNDSKLIGPIFHFVRSEEYKTEVRKRNQKLVVDTSAMIDVPFDVEQWQKVAQDIGPLPEPYSNDPTQWLFKGYSVDSTAPLQVAVARLLGYCWPKQKSDDFDSYAVKDGIICLPSVAGEERAVERLRTSLAAAFGEAWSPAQQDRLLTDVGFGGKSLDIWLRDGFFTQHCSLFHNRPFIWHIWDGLKDGFSALVNSHQLDAACLDRLIYTYLGSWIMTQKAERDAGVPGAEARLVAAINLQKKLEAIRDGEPPYDIYVRWKQLHEQPMGWNPDLNDGVRINIRPFDTAGILRSRFTINWNKDRGTNPDGSERLNDLHYTLAEKREARQVTIQSG